MIPNYFADRASGTLDAQLASSQTNGTFTFSSLSNLGSQSWASTAGYNAIITIESEQILCSSVTVSSGTATATIATSGRGYNGTTAATHAASTAVTLNVTAKAIENIQAEVWNHVKGLIGYDANANPLPTVTDNHTLSVAGSDATALFTAGRAFFVVISSTYYRCVVRSSSFSTNTTINLSSDTLPGSGTVTAIYFEMNVSTKQAIDYQLLKGASNVPAQNPPAGYVWLYAKSKCLFVKDESGNTRFLCPVVASTSSSSGVITCDWSLANVYTITLTENVTGLTHQNGVDGQSYKLIIKQHASAAKTVALGTSGGTRFGTTITGFTMSTTTSYKDYLVFHFDGTDSKYDLTGICQGQH